MKLTNGNDLSLTPELLASVGARYSRSNDGLEAILSKVDREDMGGSVDRIFKMVDYGHQSIADMATVSIFMDDISILLAYIVWSVCPTAAGQESSTRYIKMEREGCVSASDLGCSEEGWYEHLDKCFKAYDEACTYWESQCPDGLNERMRRNFVFDRARYYIPVACKTNMMMVMGSRGWMQLCQHLLSHWMPEAVTLGEMIVNELHHSVPRMSKHAVYTESFSTSKPGHASSSPHCHPKECEPRCSIWKPGGCQEITKKHDNRYDLQSVDARRTSVRFSLSAIAFAEIRDLNRHRTGSKYCPLQSVGFYEPRGGSFDSGNEPGKFVLGTQLYFEHTTTFDKFIYEAELRTGLGAHFRYAEHMRDVVSCLNWKDRKAIQLGTAEPE